MSYEKEVKSLKEDIAKCASKEEMAVLKKGYIKLLSLS